MPPDFYPYVRWIHVLAASAWFGEVVAINFILIPTLSSYQGEGRKSFLSNVFPRVFRMASILSATGRRHGRPAPPPSCGLRPSEPHREPLGYSSRRRRSSSLRSRGSASRSFSRPAASFERITSARDDTMMCRPSAASISMASRLRS